jgi:drug/metabolite transporter (DMT)-like permease
MWVALSLSAGALQTARNAASKRLGDRVAPDLNSWARFAFALPFATVAAITLSGIDRLPTLPTAFLATSLVAAVSQLLANVALVAAFRRTSFAEAIVLHKLEVVFTAMAGALWFSEAPTAVGWAGIAACAVGTAMLNIQRDPRAPALSRLLRLDAGAALALTAAALLVVASFSVKRAVVLLGAANPELSATALAVPAHTLLHVTWMEVALLTVAILMRQPGAFRQVAPNAGGMLLVGVAAFASSLCWYGAFAHGFVAYVRALGQVEMVLSLVLGIALFREQKTWRQLPGAAVTIAGMLAVLLPTSG